MSRSRNCRRTSQLGRCIEWGKRRVGDIHYLGTPNRFQKRETNRRERLIAARHLRNEVLHADNKD